MPMTKSHATAVRHLLSAAAGTVPGSGEVAAAGRRLDLEAAEVLGTTPILSRPWARKADAHEAAELAELEELEAAEDPTEEVPA